MAHWWLVKRPNRKAAIVAATEELVRTKGLSQATTRAIAQKAGCSEGAIYLYFPGRAELMLAVFEQSLPGMLGTLGELDQQAGRATPARNLAQALRALFDFQLRVLPQMAALFAEPELLASYRRQFAGRGRKGPAGGVARLERYLGAEQSLGRVDAGLDCEMAARALLAGCFFHAFTKLFFGKAEPFAPFAQRLIASQLGLRGTNRISRSAGR